MGEAFHVCGTIAIEEERERPQMKRICGFLRKERNQEGRIYPLLYWTTNWSNSRVKTPSQEKNSLFPLWRPKFLRKSMNSWKNFYLVWPFPKNKPDFNFSRGWNVPVPVRSTVEVHVGVGAKKIFLYMRDTTRKIALPVSFLGTAFRFHLRKPGTREGTVSVIHHFCGTSGSSCLSMVWFVISNIPRAVNHFLSREKW